jgi:hypothetical protein
MIQNQTPNPATARFTPQQAASSPARDTSMRFDSRFTQSTVVDQFGKTQPQFPPDPTCCPLSHRPMQKKSCESSTAAFLRSLRGASAHSFRVRAQTQSTRNTNRTPNPATARFTPIARSVLPRQPNFNTIRFSFFPEVLCYPILGMSLTNSALDAKSNQVHMSVHPAAALKARPTG